MADAQRGIHKLKEKTKMEVRALLESAPVAITVWDAPRHYKEQTGCSLPFRQLGFSSAEELFRSMPDTVLITQSVKGPVLKCVAIDCTQHVVRMVRAQRKMMTKRFQLPMGAPVGPRPSAVSDEAQTSSLTNHLHSLTNEQTSAGNPRVPPSCLTVQAGPVSSSVARSPIHQDCQTAKVQTGVRINSTSVRISPSLPLPMECPKLSPDKKRPSSSATLSHAIGDKIKATFRPSETLSHSSSSRMDRKNSDAQTPNVSLELKKKLMQVFHDDPLNLDSLKHYTTEALFLYLSDIIILDYVDEKTILVKATATGQKLLEVPVPKPEKFRLKTLPTTIAEDAVITSQLVKWQSLPKLSSEKKYIEVYVTYLVNPGFFCVRLRGIDTSVALDDLIDSMSLVYCHPVLSNQYVVPNELIVAPGFYCAALYPAEQTWHRAIISGINSEGTINVLYVDFGNVSTISKTALRLLKREYLKLPAQAIKAKLANIMPIRGAANKWSPASIQRFKELCVNMPFVASVLDSDVSQVSLCLYDTSGDIDIRINDTLVAENHATLAIFQPAVAQYNQLLGRMADPRAELQASMSSMDKAGKPSVGSHGHKLPSSSSSSTNAAELITSLDEIKPNQTEELAQGLGEIQLEPNFYHINEALLIGRTFHVVRLGSRDFIPTFEVSKLFWKRDILRRILMLTPLRVDFCVIEKASQPVLHRELSMLQKTGSASDSNLALCPLNRIPDILLLSTFNECGLLQAFIDLVKLRGA